MGQVTFAERKGRRDKGDSKSGLWGQTEQGLALSSTNCSKGNLGNASNLFELHFFFQTAKYV